MSEIEEGDQVVTPEGETVEYTGQTNDGRITISEQVKKGPHSFDRTLSCYPEDCVNVDQPIRVRVSRQFYAESLVVLAREYGFDDESGNHWGVIYKLSPNKGKIDTCPDPFDDQTVLTYRDDLPKIEAWLQANGESEDECETCHGTTTGRIGPSHTQYDCPDCTDGSEEYDEPQPEDEELQIPQELNEHLTEIAEYVGQLQAELQDCWENQQEYKNDVAELQEQLQDVREERDRYIQELGNRDATIQLLQNDIEKLQERIEEAREHAEHHLSRQGNGNERSYLVYFLEDQLEILSPDSDEGE